MRCFFTLLAAAKLVAVVGEPLVFILPSSDKAKATTKQPIHNERSKDVDFGRTLQAQDIKSPDLLSDEKLDPSKISHIPEPKKAAFQSAGETGLLDFDSPLEAVFTSKFHLQDTVRHLGKGSKSESSKSGKNSKSKSSKPKSSKSKPYKPKSSKSKPSKSSKSKSSARSAHHSSASTSSYESRSTSSDSSFSYHIGSDSLWSMDEDEAEDSTTPEFGRPPKAKTAVTASPVSANSTPDIVYFVEPVPREEKLLVSDFTNLDASSTPVVSSAIKPTPTVDIEGDALGSNRMYYVAGAALFGGLVAFVASIIIKRKVNPGNTHTKLNESTVQDDTMTGSEGEGSFHYDSWLASDMRAW